MDEICEIVTIELLLPKLKKSIISCLYRAPSSSVNMFTDICTNRTVFIVGDMNIDMLDSKNVHHINLMNSFGLHNVINKPSRVTSSSETCIDTIFTNSTSMKSGLIMDDISDHLPILCISDISFKRTQLPIQEKRKVNKKKLIICCVF